MTHDHAPSRRQRIQLCVALVIVALVPALYAGLLTWANGDTSGRINQVPAVIVNADRPATLDDGTTLELGDRLTGELVDSTESNNFSWTAADAQTARSELASGEVLAVVWVPEDFSSGVASLQGDASSAVRAELTIETDDAVNTVAGSMAASIGDAISDALAESVSQEYLENVYLAFTDTQDAVSEAADGAAGLHEGVQSVTKGSNHLVVGLTDLTSGATDLATGTATLADGTQDVSDGAAGLRDGLDEVNAGGATLAQGATDLADGASQLERGVGQLAARAPDLAEAADSLSDGADAALTGATALRDGLGQLQSTTGQIASGTASVHEGLEGLDSDWDNLTDAERRAIVGQLATRSGTLSDGATGIEQATGELHAGATNLVGTSDDTGLRALVAGESQLAARAQTISTSVATLSTGATDIADGAAHLSSGITELLVSVDRLARGSATLAEASQAVADGSSQLRTGADDVVDGTREAATGATTLSSGLSDLEDGADDLATGLAEGRDEIPTYSDAEAAHLAEVASTPVEHTATRANEVPTSAYGMGPYFMALALWIGGIAFYLLTEPLRRGGLGTWLGGLSSFAPGAVMAAAQSLSLVVTVRYLLGVEAVDLAGLTALAMLASLTFVAINQAFVALLGTPGRFLALILIVLQLAAAGGTYPVQTAPELFGVVDDWLPLTHAVRGFRSLIAGGSIDLSDGVLIIVAWLVASLAITTLAAKRHGQPAQEADGVPSGRGATRSPAAETTGSQGG